MTATDSDAREREPGGGAGTVHCAVHDPGETPDSGVDARPRVRTREGSGESAQSQAPSAPAVDLRKEPAPITLGERFPDLRTMFSPPDIWLQDRPSLSSVWAYASHGDWTNPAGAPRRIGQMYALLASVPVVAIAYTLAWTAERPARLAAVIVLLVLLAQVPPLSWLI